MILKYICYISIQIKPTCGLLLGLFFTGLLIGLEANPIFLRAISEVQIAPDNTERLELRHFRSSTTDTVDNNVYPLINTVIYTPVGIAVIDTDMYLPGMDYAVIDTSVLTGDFSLPDDSGFVTVVGEISSHDSLNYPQDVPPPPVHHSISLFHTYGVEGKSLYWLIADWYLDPTPTFGTHNDDYPGCMLSGHIYNSGSEPLQDAQIIATVYCDSGWYIVNTPPFYKCCTTYSDIDGFYVLDSLLPVLYWIEAYAWPAYYPDTQLTSELKSLQPITDFDFYLEQTGIFESNRDKNINSGLIYAYPNPVFDHLNIHLPKPQRFIDIYDITGAVRLHYRNQHLSNLFQIDLAGLSKGVYFILINETKLKILKL